MEMPPTAIVAVRTSWTPNVPPPVVEMMLYPVRNFSDPTGMSRVGDVCDNTVAPPAAINCSVAVNEVTAAPFTISPASIAYTATSGGRFTLFPLTVKATVGYWAFV